MLRFLWAEDVVLYSFQQGLYPVVKFLFLFAALPVKGCSLPFSFLFLVYYFYGISYYASILESH